MNLSRILASFIQNVTPISHKTRRESLRAAVQSCIEKNTYRHRLWAGYRWRYQGKTSYKTS